MSTAAQEIIDVSVAKLRLGVLGRKSGLSTDVGPVLTGGTLTQTMVGASDLKLTLTDRDYEALNSGVFEQKIRVVLDGTPYSFTELSLVDQEVLELSFEHWLIAEMRTHTRPLHAQRNSMTRAEFIFRMLRELKLPFAFVCPELHRKQTVKAPSASEIAATSQHIEGMEEAKRSAHPSGPLTVKGQAISDAQRQLLAEALGAVEGVGASTRAEEALVVALIQEADVSNPTGGDADSSGPLQVRASTARGIQKQDGHGFLNPRDVAEVSIHFVVAGYYGKGGANALADAHHDWTPGHIAQEVQGSAFPSAYDKWKDEAKKIVAAFQGGEGFTETSKSKGGSHKGAEKTSAYEYSRGLPEEPEDTFTASLRLAEEVLWRFFVVARKGVKASIYYVSDDDLIRAKPRYLIDPDTKGAGKLTFDVEVGKRLVSMRGRKIPKPSEAQLEARIDRWEAPPGCVVELAEYGLGSGKWLVDSIERPLFDAAGTVHLRKPQKALQEPRESAGQASALNEAEQGGGQEASAADKAKLAKDHPELKPGVRDVVAVILAKFPRLTITSTTSGTHASHSLHFEGRAADLATSDQSYMDSAGAWIQKNMESVLTEGIHNPTLAVKDGKRVDGSSFYSSVWAGHVDHIHIGV